MPQIAMLRKTMQRWQKNSFQRKSSHCGKFGAKWPKNKRAVWQSQERNGKNARLKKPMPVYGNARSVNLQSPKKENAQRAWDLLTSPARSMSELRILSLRWCATLLDAMALHIPSKDSSSCSLASSRHFLLLKIKPWCRWYFSFFVKLSAGLTRMDVIDVGSGSSLDKSILRLPAGRSRKDSMA